MNPTELPQKRHGCMFYVGIVALTFLLLVLGGIGFGYLTLRKAVNTWTDTQPVTLPQSDMSQAEAAQVQQRIESFQKAIERGTTTQPLVLTPREINGMISTSPDFAQIKGKVHLAIEDGQLRGQISLPLNQSGAGFLKGRYLNGAGTVKSSLKDGKLELTLEKVQVKGQPLPDILMNRVSGINFAQPMNEDPNAAKIIGKLQSIQVTNGQIVIVPGTGGNTEQ